MLRPTLWILLVALAATAAAQSDGLDLALRSPSQQAFIVDGTPFNALGARGEVGDQITAIVEIRNQTGSGSATVQLALWWDQTVLATRNVTWNGTDRYEIDAIVPEAGAHTVHVRMQTGAWDPNPDNQQTRPTPIQIGAPEAFAGDAAVRLPWLGPILFAALVLSPVALRLGPVRARADGVIGGLKRRFEALQIRWLHRDEQEEMHPNRRMAILAGVCLVLASLAAWQSGWLVLLQGTLIATVVVGITLVVQLVLRRCQIGRRTAVALLAIAAGAWAWHLASLIVPWLRWPAVEGLAPFAVLGLTMGAMYGLIAIGYTMVYGVLRLINFAHGEVFLWGGYFGWLMVVQWGMAALPLAMLLAMAMTALLGVTIERVAYRRLRGAGRLSPLITAIAMSLLLASLAQMFFTTKRHTFTEEGSAYLGSIWQRFFESAWRIGNVTLSGLDAAIFVVAVASLAALHLFVKRSRLGQAIRAVADDMETARTVGIRVDRVVAATFAIGSGLAALAGVLWGLRFTLQPTLGILTGIKAFTAAVVGGIGNIQGAFLGGLLIGLTENIGGQFIDSRLQNAITFVVLLLTLLIRPQGLLGAGVERR